MGVCVVYVRKMRVSEAKKVITRLWVEIMEGRDDREKARERVR